MLQSIVLIAFALISGIVASPIKLASETIGYSTFQAEPESAPIGLDVCLTEFTNGAGKPCEGVPFIQPEEPDTPAVVPNTPVDSGETPEPVFGAQVCRTEETNGAGTPC